MTLEEIADASLEELERRLLPMDFPIRHFASGMRGRGPAALGRKRKSDQTRLAGCARAHRVKRCGYMWAKNLPESTDAGRRIGAIPLYAAVEGVGMRVIYSPEEFSGKPIGAGAGEF